LAVVRAYERMLTGDLPAARRSARQAIDVDSQCDPLSTGVVYCEPVCVLQGLAQYDVAEEWTEAMEGWCDQEEGAPVPVAPNGLANPVLPPARARIAVTQMTITDVAAVRLAATAW
jgi:hypothetical protein